MYGTVEPETADYFGHVLRIYGLALPGIGISLLLNYYLQAIDRRGLFASLTALEALLPAGLSYVLAPCFQEGGIWADLVAGELISMLVVFAILLFDNRRSHGERLLMLPISNARSVFSSTVEMDLARVEEMPEEVSRLMEERVGHETAPNVCLALKEALAGIVGANEGVRDVVDVSIQDTEDDVVISLRDMGAGFDPLANEGEPGSSIGSAAVLRRIADEIKFDLSLGMNATTIRLDKTCANAQTGREDI